MKALQGAAGVQWTAKDNEFNSPRDVWNEVVQRHKRSGLPKVAHMLAEATTVCGLAVMMPVRLPPYVALPAQILVTIQQHCGSCSSAWTPATQRSWFIASLRVTTADDTVDKAITWELEEIKKSTRFPVVHYVSVTCSQAAVLARTAAAVFGVAAVSTSRMSRSTETPLGASPTTTAVRPAWR